MGAARDLWYSFRYCRTPEGRGSSRLVTVLASSRLCVLPMTWYSVLIGALTAAVMGYRVDPLLAGLLLAGFSLAHLADNLLNDLYDYLRGLDDPAYFRSLYGPHPLVHGLVSPEAVRLFVSAVLIADMALAAYLGLHVTPIIPVLALAGLVVMAGYAGLLFDAKRAGLGEVLVGLVWGPVMAGGTILALAGSHPAPALGSYVAFAVGVSLVLVGKHMDKYPMDKAKGVGTLPVRLGLDRAARLASWTAIILPPLAAAGLYMLVGAPYSLAPLAGLPLALTAARLLRRPKPENPPPSWKVWPLWYVAHAYAVMDSIGRTTIAGLTSALLLLRGHAAASLALLALAALWELAVYGSYKRIAEGWQ